MIGSLEQFLPVDKRKMEAKFFFSSQSSPLGYSAPISPNKKHLNYITSDKAVFLHPKHSSRIKSQSSIKQREFLFQKDIIPQRKKQHWIEKNFINKASLKHEDQLLYAVAKTQEDEIKKRKKTFFEQSYDNLASGYKKIYIKPVLNFVRTQTKKNEVYEPNLKRIRERRTQLSREKVILLQNSIKWAEKHKKPLNSFYKSAGKVSDLKDKETMTKNNYQLQDQYNFKRLQENSRIQRKSLLMKIRQKRVLRKKSTT